MSHNARYARLAIEYTKLMNLAARSSFIEVDPVEVQPGWPPEKYVITYKCRGIAAIDAQGAPQVSDFHQVSMYMGSDYPLKEPYLRWLTPIWHPNIDHREPHHVCTNNVQNWFSAKPLAELVLAMGEMVQYKHYHAKWISPFPLDRDAADWVLQVAEPKGIIGPHKPFDDRPLLRPQRMCKQSYYAGVTSPIQAYKRIRLGRAQVDDGAEETDHAEDNLMVSLSGSRQLQSVSRAIRFGGQTRAPNDTKRLVPPREPGFETLPGYSLEISKDGKFQRTEQMTKKQLLIGRGAIGKPVDLVLEGDLTMSRLHLILERDDTGAFWVTAKGQNPVFVNGRAIPRERSIGVDMGQVIQICSYSITIR
jgi:ubiquitin-protein ligase